MANKSSKPPIGSTRGLAMVVEHADRAPTADGQMFSFDARSYEGRQMLGAECSLTVVEGSVAISALEMSFNGPRIGAGANVGILSGASAEFNFEFGGAEVRTPVGSVRVGLDFSTSVSLGFTGVEVQVLGFGLHVGLFGFKVGIPICELAMGHCHGN